MESGGHPFVSLQDEVTVKDIATDEKSSDMSGWLQHAHAWLFEADILADVAADPVLLRIHSTAEEFEPAAEECFAPLQVCVLTSDHLGL